jgi:hypothetical protein
VFLVEEPSMRSFLNELLPRVLPDKLSYDILAHEGKTDLEGSIPRKIRGYNIPGYEIQFVILRDQHGGDCIAMKRRLQQICEQAGRNDVLIRIVCSELESWYLGDLVAIETAFQISNLSSLQNKRSYRNPDQLTNAADLIYQLVPGFVKSNGGKIARHINLTVNCSRSFQVFLSGLQRIIDESA